MRRARCGWIACEILGRASKEYLREGTRIELYCAAQTKPAQVPAIFTQLRQDPGNAQNLVRFVAEEASYQYERANCSPVLRLREEYFEKYYNYSEIEELAVMSAWCRWQQQDWETLDQEVQALAKRGYAMKISCLCSNWSWPYVNRMRRKFVEPCALCVSESYVVKGPIERCGMLHPGDGGNFC